jgi:hypothetical protein
MESLLFGVCWFRRLIGDDQKFPKCFCKFPRELIEQQVCIQSELAVEIPKDKFSSSVFGRKNHKFSAACNIALVLSKLAKKFFVAPVKIA